MISICVPTYNNACYLPEMIASVMGQNYKDWELVLVDDGSTDSTPEIMKYYTDPRIRYIRRERNKGIAYSRNQAVSEANGQFIAVMDSDDLMAPDRLSTAIRKLEKSEVDFVYSSYLMSDEEGHVHQGGWLMPPEKLTYKDVIAGYTAPHVTIVAKKKCFAENPYREQDKVNDDLPLVLNWLRAGYTYRRIRKPSVNVRLHDSSVSKTRDKEIKKITEEMKTLFRKELGAEQS